MSDLSRCSVPRNAPVANSNTKNSYDGARLANPGVPGSGGRPLPGGAQSCSAGVECGWMQVHPAAMSWAGVTLSAAAGPAVASVAPPASAAAAIRVLTLIRGIFMIALLLWGRHAGSAAVRGLVRGGPVRSRYPWPAGHDRLSG